MGRGDGEDMKKLFNWLMWKHDKRIIVSTIEWWDFDGSLSMRDEALRKLEIRYIQENR